jgi:hypothetical protein
MNLGMDSLNIKSMMKGNILVKKDMIPKILFIVEKSSEEIQIEAGLAFNELLKENIIEDQELIKKMHFTSSKVLNTWSQDVLVEWRKVFKLSMKVLSNEEKKESMD